MHKLSPVCYLYTHFKQSIFETSLLIQLLQDCQYIKSAQQSLHGVIERLIFFFFFFFFFFLGGGGQNKAEQTQTTRRLIRISSVCLQKDLLRLNESEKKNTPTPLKVVMDWSF